MDNAMIVICPAPRHKHPGMPAIGGARQELGCSFCRGLAIGPLLLKPWAQLSHLHHGQQE
jgi:hypothetical protein